MSLSRQDEDIWKMRHAYRVMNKDDFKTTASEDVQNRLMASLVPDEIIYNSDDSTPKSYKGCLMFAEISGFTELCERLNKTDTAGALRLTSILNKYIGTMIHEIISHDGDVMKFSGDELIALWKQNETQTVRKAVHKAIDCASIIQKICRSYKAAFDGILKVKLAISAGFINFAMIGGEQSADYVIVGEPVWDFQNAVSICKSGEVILSPTAWLYTNMYKYTAIEVLNGGYIKIQDEPSVNVDDDSVATNHNALSGSLRPCIDIAIRSNVHQHLQKFILKPLQKTIKMNESLENLTEIRPVVVVSINVCYNISESQKVIELANETYKLVCRFAEEGHGCLHKVSLSKRNIKFHVIFGLRGLKHELECQFALQCATECHHSIHRLESVTSVSIGITTGEIFYGLCGDILRRGYLVIGFTVNRADRLTTIHPNKVTCDRETFLNSKSKAASFILQETHEISQPSPVYEYCGEVKSIRSADIHAISAFPLLGNKNELTLYKELLHTFLQSPENSNKRIRKMLVIQGVSRQGKTRLLQEFIYATPQEIPVYKFSLSENDNQTPFQTLKSIFWSSLQLSLDSSQEDINQKVAEALEGSRPTDLHYLVNDIFGTDFEEATNRNLYLRLPIMRFMAECDLLRKLCLKIFKTKTIIVIDNFEYIDNRSWEYIDVLLDSPNIFILASISYGKPINTMLNQMFVDKRVKVTVLKAVDRWFHGAFACQFLNVYAIPPELENAIQSKSNGNPGWIENFLISLLHSGCITIKKTNMKKINDARLICPPLYMLKRLSPSEKYEWQQLMEERHAPLDALSDETDDDWRKFIDICRDSDTDIVVREQVHIKLKYPTVVAVCLFTSGSNFNQFVCNVHESSIDTVIIRTFDAMLPDEQLMLKCSASLGDHFFRDMLLYVLGIGSPRKAALAIKKLFELKVLACAEGDFIEGTNIVTSIESVSLQNYKRITCKCCHEKIHDTCRDLPVYASCRHIQFCSTRARQIASNLSSDEEKKRYHLRAIEFLEKQPRKCRTCRFDQIIDTPADQHLLVHPVRTFPSIPSSVAANSIRRPISLPSTSTPNELSTITVPATPTESDSSINSTTKKFRSIWGFRCISKSRERYALVVRDYSSADFLNCTCLPILTTTYSQLTAHCKIVGEWSKLIDGMIKYADVAIRSSNLQLASAILNEALDVLKITPQADLPCKSNLIRGKIYSLLGHTYMELDKFEDAEIQLQLALKQYRYRFPYNKLSRKLKTLKLRLNQSFGLFVLTNTLTKKNMGHSESNICNNVSEILAHMATLFMKRNQWQYAELAAIWSLSEALNTNNHFKILCAAYTNMLVIATHYKRITLSVALEAYAMELCNTEMRDLEQEELKAVTKLYTSIFWSALLQADLEKAKQIGGIALRIATSIPASEIVVPILPMLMYSCLLTKDVDGAVETLNQLRWFAEDNYDRSAHLWYYVQCMAFHLETGFAITSHDECEQFVEEMGCEDFIKIKDKNARNHFCVTMWLWCVRNRNWDKSSEWYRKIKEFYPLENNDGVVVNQLTGLYLLEGLITTFVHKIDGAGIQSCLDIQKEIEVLIKSLEKSPKTMEILMPRLLHLKAYYCIARQHDVKAFKYLEKANFSAVDYKNTLEKEWTMHSVMAWKQTMDKVTMGFWKRHCNGQNQLYYREINRNDGKFGFFTLRLPMYRYWT